MYLGFPAHRDPGYRKASRRTRDLIETMTDEQMLWRMCHPAAEYETQGRYLVDSGPIVPSVWPPARVTARAPTYWRKLVVFYHVTY